MVMCEHCRSSERPAVCNECWFAMVKGVKNQQAINGELTYQNLELQKKLDLARDEIEFLREKLSGMVKRK